MKRETTTETTLETVVFLRSELEAMKKKIEKECSLKFKDGSVRQAWLLEGRFTMLKELLK